MRTPVPSNEPERLESLGRLAIMNTPPEPAFDDIARLAAQVCRTPMALVNFVDRGRVWSKANIGFPEPVISRAVSFCTHVVASGDILLVNDAYIDARFKLSPLVIQGPRARFYAGVPLMDDKLQAVGTLCVMDVEPRSLDDAQVASLWALARQASALLQSSRQVASVEASAMGQRRLSKAGKARGEELRRLVQQMPAALWATDRQLRFTSCIGSRIEEMNMHYRDVAGKTLFEFFRTDDPEFPPIAAHIRALSGETPAPMRWNGWHRTFEVHVEPFRDEEGNVAGSLGMAMDISERAQLERELAYAEAKYRHMLESIRCDVVVDGNSREIAAEATRAATATRAAGLVAAVSAGPDEKTHVPNVVRIDIAG